VVRTAGDTTARSPDRPPARARGAPPGPAARRRRPACSRAVRPGLGAVARQQRGSPPILLVLGSPRRVAPAADAAPGLAVELVLAAIAAVRRHRGRVSLGFALRYRLQARIHPRRAHHLLILGIDAQRAQRARVEQAVRLELVRALEALHRPPGLLPDDSVGLDAKRALDRDDCRFAEA